MIHAYSELYVDDAMEHLGEAVDYAVNRCFIPISDFGRMFAESEYSDLFGNGTPFVVTGMSGIELAQDILDRNIVGKKWPYGLELVSYGPEYWSGWALAQYQWRTCRTFRSILSRVPLEEIAEMYYSHGENLQSFFEEMDRLYLERQKETNLRRMRKTNGLSQQELSDASGVKLRSIQMWEQRVNRIDKAQANSLYRLAHVLHCSIEDLLEDPIFCGEVNIDQGD